MQLELETFQHSVSAYGAGYVEVDAQRYHEPLLLRYGFAPVAALPEAFSPSWWQLIFQAEPEVLLLGLYQRPEAKTLQPAFARQLMPECMEPAAMLRTYNLLSSDARPVVAVLIDLPR